jgi:hypothetical protein
MLAFNKDHPLIINRNDATIRLWDVDKNEYETHTFEFIEDLADLIATKQESSEGVTVIPPVYV